MQYLGMLVSNGTAHHSSMSPTQMQYIGHRLPCDRGAATARACERWRCQGGYNGGVRKCGIEAVMRAAIESPHGAWRRSHGTQLFWTASHDALWRCAAEQVTRAREL